MKQREDNSKSEVRLSWSGKKSKRRVRGECRTSDRRRSGQAMGGVGRLQMELVGWR